MSLYERYRVIGPETDKVVRVLDAARAWRKAFAESRSVSYSLSIDALIEAVDALDAPVERYRIHDGGERRAHYERWSVLDKGKNGEMTGMALAYTSSRGDAEMICAALNAAERRV